MVREILNLAENLLATEAYLVTDFSSKYNICLPSILTTIAEVKIQNKVIFTDLTNLTIKGVSHRYTVGLHLQSKS